MRVAGITDSDGLLDLAKSLGSPIPSLSGKLVKRLTVVPAAAGKARTLSAVHGTGEFPLHTDTAFWPVPARYLVFRAEGDIRRRTVVCTFDHLFARCGSTQDLMEMSLWVVRTPQASFYSAMRFREGTHVGWRYDGNCMCPANRAACEFQRLWEQAVASDEPDEISWDNNSAIVISNWIALHGRGPQPQDERERILERVYVR